MSGCENREAFKKFEGKCCSGLLVFGENVPRPERVQPGILTGAELPNTPDDASPTDIELLTFCESDSKSLSKPDKFNVSSRCKSSKVFAEKIQKY